MRYCCYSCCQNPAISQEEGPVLKSESFCVKHQHAVESETILRAGDIVFHRTHNRVVLVEAIQGPKFWSFGGEGWNWEVVVLEKSKDSVHEAIVSLWAQSPYTDDIRCQLNRKLFTSKLQKKDGS